MSAVDDDLPATTTEPPSGVRRFFPDLFAIEAFVALAMLAVLVVLSSVTHASLEAAASRDAAGYVPRPEWYFLWLFQLLKYFKGNLEMVGTTVVPLAIIALLVAVPFLDRRTPKTTRFLGRGRQVRVLPRGIAIVLIAIVLMLTIVAAASNRGAASAVPPPATPVWPPQSTLDRGPIEPTALVCGPDTTRGSHVRVVQ